MNGTLIGRLVTTCHSSLRGCPSSELLNHFPFLEMFMKLLVNNTFFPLIAELTLTLYFKQTVPSLKDKSCFIWHFVNRNRFQTVSVSMGFTKWQNMTDFRYDTWFGTSTNTTNHLVNCPIPETGPIVNIWVSTTLFHPRQTRKGAQCSKYRTFKQQLSRAHN